MTAFGILLLCVIVALLIPSRFDPAIRLKEWNIKRNMKNE